MDGRAGARNRGQGKPTGIRDPGGEEKGNGSWEGVARITDAWTEFLKIPGE